MFPPHTIHPTPLRLGFSYIFLTSQSKYAGETYRLILPLHVGKLGGSCAFCAALVTHGSGILKATVWTGRLRTGPTFSPDMTKHLIICFNVWQLCGSQWHLEHIFQPYVHYILGWKGPKEINHHCPTAESNTPNHFWPLFPDLSLKVCRTEGSQGTLFQCLPFLTARRVFLLYNTS